MQKIFTIIAILSTNYLHAEIVDNPTLMKGVRKTTYVGTAGIYSDVHVKSVKNDYQFEDQIRREGVAVFAGKSLSDRVTVNARSEGYFKVDYPEQRWIAGKGNGYGAGVGIKYLASSTDETMVIFFSDLSYRRHFLKMSADTEYASFDFQDFKSEFTATELMIGGAIGMRVWSNVIVDLGLHVLPYEETMIHETGTLDYKNSNTDVEFATHNLRAKRVDIVGGSFGVHGIVNESTRVFAAATFRTELAAQVGAAQLL